MRVQHDLMIDRSIGIFQTFLDVKPLLLPAGRFRSEGNSGSTLFCIEVFFQFLEGAWPIVFQKTREGAVGIDSPIGLALGTVVAFVFGIHNPLNRRAAPRTRFFVTAVDSHFSVESSNLVGKRAAQFVLQIIYPLQQCLATCSKEPTCLLIVEPMGILKR